MHGLLDVPGGQYSHMFISHAMILIQGVANVDEDRNVFPGDTKDIYLSRTLEMRFADLAQTQGGKRVPDSTADSNAAVRFHQGSMGMEESTVIWPRAAMAWRSNLIIGRPCALVISPNT